MDFGITPHRLAEVVALWRRCGREVALLDLPDGDLVAVESEAVAALNDCRRTATEATAARSGQLDALAEALSHFGALTEEADAAAAAALAERRRA